MTERILLMFDYAAIPPLWGMDGGGHRTQPLPIEPGLLAELNEWANVGEALLRGDHDSSSIRYTAWNNDGRQLAARLREDLGEKFEVWYFDEVYNQHTIVDW